MATLTITPPKNRTSGRNSSDQSLTSQTSPQDATGISVAVDANKAYSFRLYAPFNLAGVVSGYKFQLVGPNSPTNYIATYKLFTSLGALLGEATQTSLSTLISGALATIGDHLIEINGLLENGVNSGTLKLQFAQNTSDGSAIVLKRGSFIELQEI